MTGREEAKTFYQEKAEREVKLMEAMEKGLLRRNVDKDGDILMGGEESVSVLQPTDKLQGQASQNQVHQTDDLRFVNPLVKELNKKLQLVQGQVLSLQWK